MLKGLLILFIEGVITLPVLVAALAIAIGLIALIGIGLTPAKTPESRQINK